MSRLGDLPPTNEPSTCLLCDILLGPVWAVMALVGVAGAAPRFTRNEWVLFASFWSVVVVVLALCVAGR